MTTVGSKINWKKALRDDLYSQKVSTAICPLLVSSTFQSIDDLNTEIITICSLLHMAHGAELGLGMRLHCMQHTSNAASTCLPSIRLHKVKKSYFNVPKLRLLCEHSQIKSLGEWKSAGRPCEGQLYADKRDKESSPSVCHLEQGRSRIQSHKLLFKENSRNRFKSLSVSKAECMQRPED